MEKQQWDLSKAIGHKFPAYEYKVTNNDVILYSLGIGFQADPMNKSHYNFTYENGEEFQAFPTMGVVIAHRASLGDLSVPGMPTFNPMMLLHGEESLEVHKPIEPDMVLAVQETLVDLQDKTKATVMVIQTDAVDKESGDLIFRVITNLFIRGIGGFGNKGKIKISIPPAPKTNPDHVIEEKTLPNQAFLYRLNGDMNPLHVDPAMSEMGGFKVPILHGLCTYGFTARAVYESYFKADAQVISKFSGRFTSHVFPGETLVVHTWKNGNQIVFETKTKERGKVVLKGVCELKADAKL